MTKVWVVSGRTESGDDWVLVFDAEPNDDHIVAAIQDDPWLYNEWGAECIQGWQIQRVDIIRIGT